MKTNNYFLQQKKSQFLKYLLGIMLLAVAADYGSAQTISVIDGPDWRYNSTVYDGSPMIYNGELYVRYRNSSTSSQLAKYTAPTLKFYKNINEADEYIDNIMVFKDHLIGCYYNSITGTSNLTKFDGDSIIQIPNPDAGTGFYNYFNIAPIVYKDVLYLWYHDASTKYRLARFDGDSVTLIPNPDVPIHGYYGGAFIFNDILFFRYIDADHHERWAKYDGTASSFIVDEIAGHEISSSHIIYKDELYFGNDDGYLIKYQDTILIQYPKSYVGTNLVPNIIFNDTLFLTYVNSEAKYQLIKFDGSTLNSITNNDSGSIYLNNQFIFNGNLYVFYLNRSNKYQLAKYDGNGLMLFDNPFIDDFGLKKYYRIYPENNKIVEYKNKIYFSLIEPEYGLSELGGFDGSTIQIILSGSVYDPVVLNDTLYFRNLPDMDEAYSEVGMFNGNTTKILSNPDWGVGIINFVTVLNNTVFVSYMNHLGNKQLALISYKLNPIISWNVPPQLPTGAILSQKNFLNASADVPGSFYYMPGEGVTLSSRITHLKTYFVPDDTAHYNTVSKALTIGVTDHVSMIIWNKPADIVYGTLLDSTQLNASAYIPGTFSYSPEYGTQLDAGNNQELTLTFVPEDTSFFTETKTVLINVSKITSTITWANPSDIVYGTSLDSTQLNATSSIAGTLTYTPDEGTLLNAGNDQELSVAFTPDNSNYNTANKTVTIDVLKANQTISFNPLESKTNHDADFSLVASASSGLPVSFESSSASVASILGDVVSIEGAGSTDITASQEGNQNYNAASPVAQSLIVTEVTGLSDAGTQGISIYPNPTEGIINISIPSANKQAEIQISDVTGNVVFTGNNTGLLTIIDVSKQAEGIYFITIKSKDYIKTQKIIIK